MSTSHISSTPSSSLRPRASRLISGLSDIDDSTFNKPASRSSSLVRANSPDHNLQSSKANSLLGQGAQDGVRRRNHGGTSQRRGTKLDTTSNTFWGSSWSALQGFANDFLGDQQPSTPQRKHRRKDSIPTSTRLLSNSAQSSWGPKSSPTDYIATGSREEREAMVRAQKRKDLLSGAAAGQPDSLGKFKRRMSDEGISASAPPGDHADRDALVYLHTVMPGDTLAGITIRYSCSANVLRKANRMWNNDTVQSRKTLLLPVDDCGLKGRRISEHEADLLLDTPKDVEDTSEMPTPTVSAPANGIAEHHRKESAASSNSAKPPPSIRSAATDTEPSWVHDSWTMLPNNDRPTEIVRLPRHALGYFPPARRKSVSYSDLDTPSASLDLDRQAYFDTSNNTSAVEGASSRRSDSISQQRPRRGRLLSNATNSYFPSYLAGPGGVGTMAKNVRAPGPAQDGLNKLFASHLPNVAPPAHQQRLYMPDVPLYSDDPAAGSLLGVGSSGGTGTISPFGRAESGVLTGALTPTQTNPGVNLEQVGAAVEGWIRKLATRAQTVLETGPGGNSAHASPALSAVRGSGGGGGIPGAGRSGIGDLIEMADSWDIGGGDTVHDDGRGRIGGGGGGGGAGGAGVVRNGAKSGGPKGGKSD